MSQSSKLEEFNIETPASYRIRVQGAIDPAWLDLLGGMRTVTDPSKENEKVTVLVGSLTDQAALSGVLKTLYDLRIPILSLENLDEKLKEPLG